MVITSCVCMYEHFVYKDVLLSYVGEETFSISNRGGFAGEAGAGTPVGVGQEALCCLEL